eukprot:9743723-Prorocentrum_lima.AAC.1
MPRAPRTCLRTTPSRVMAGYPLGNVGARPSMHVRSKNVTPLRMSIWHAQCKFTTSSWRVFATHMHTLHCKRQHDIAWCMRTLSHSSLHPLIRQCCETHARAKK